MITIATTAAVAVALTADGGGGAGAGAAPMMLSSVFAVPLVASVAATCSILSLSNVMQAQSLSPMDQLDPAPWQTSREWLLEAGGARVEQEYFSCSTSSSFADGRRTRSTRAVSVATHSGDTCSWRTLRRHGSIQSVTAWDPVRDVPIHGAVGNEYLKVMASAFAAFSSSSSSSLPMQEDENGDEKSASSSRCSSHLYLGLGGGTLPMLLTTASSRRRKSFIIELDPDVIEMATNYCGFHHGDSAHNNDDDDEKSDTGISVLCDNALNHVQAVAKVGSSCTSSMIASSNKDRHHHPNQQQEQQRHGAIFVDVFGADNNVPSEFVEASFIQSLYDALEEDGIVIANFHKGSAAENRQLAMGESQYTRVFGGGGSAANCYSIPCRFQGNTIIAAIKRKRNGDRSSVPTTNGERGQHDLEDFVDRANQRANEMGWLFDPISRLNNIRVCKPS